MIRAASKDAKHIELICQRCGSLAANLKEYVMHKKQAHHVRVQDSINSLRQLGMDDDSFDTLMEEYKDEKHHRDYIRAARKELKSLMEKFNKYSQT